MNARTILQYCIGPIGAALVGFISVPLMAWIFSVEDVGRLSILQLAINFIIIFFCLGLDQVYGREYYDEENKANLFTSVTMPGAFTLLSFSLLVLLFEPKIISSFLYDIPSEYLSVLTLLCFIINFISRFLAISLRMQERALAYSMSQLLPNLLLFLLLLCLLAIDENLTFYSLIFVYFFSITTIFCYLIWQNRILLREVFISRSINFEKLNTYIRFGMPLIIGGLASWGLTSIDRFFLKSMSTLEELGLYSLTVTIAGGVAILAGVFNTIWAPLVFKWESEGVDLKKVNSVYENLLAVVFFISVLSGIFSWIITLLLPNDYGIVKSLLPMSLLCPLLYTLSEVSSIGILLTRKTSYSMLASIGALIICLVSNFILVPTYGAVGAAFSTGISFWFFFLLRTEFSSYVWRPMPRVRVYSMTVILIIMASLHLFFRDYYFVIVSIYTISMVFGFVLFRRSYIVFFKKVVIFKSLKS